MSEPHINWMRCFLCRLKSTDVLEFKSLDISVCTASKKNIKEVVLHLARRIDTEIHIPRNEWLCPSCYSKIMEYDAYMMKMLKMQSQLSHLVEKALISVDSDFELELDEHMKELCDDSNFNEFVDVSDNEIDQTIHEALTGKPKRTNSLKRRREAAANDDCSRPKRDALQCNFCVLKFMSKDRLQKHITQAHKKYSCEHCNYSHRNEDYVLLHMNLHEGRNENACRFCNKEFTTKISAIRHMEVHLDTKKYQCDKCGLCFSQTTVLYNHKLQHEAEEQPLRCEICNQVFKTKRTYRHHMIIHRADRPRYSCEFCPKTFTEKYTLKMHMRNHPEAMTHADNGLEQQVQHVTVTTSVDHSGPADESSVVEAKYNCIICEQLFISQDYLNRHMEQDHDVILKQLTDTFSPFEVLTQSPSKPCHICDNLFNTQTNLDAHLENVHGVSFK